MGNCNPNSTSNDPNNERPKPRPRPKPELNRPTSIGTSKIIVVGNQRVGKTSLIKSYVNNTVTDRASPYVMTNAVQDFEKVTQVTSDSGVQTTVKLNIWDAAGDQDMHNLLHLYANNVHVAVLVYAIDSTLSFDQLTQW